MKGYQPPFTSNICKSHSEEFTAWRSISTDNLPNIVAIDTVSSPNILSNNSSETTKGEYHVKRMCTRKGIEGQRFPCDFELGDIQTSQVCVSVLNSSTGNTVNQHEEFLDSSTEDVIIELNHIRMDTLPEEDEENALLK